MAYSAQKQLVEPEVELALVVAEVVQREARVEELALAPVSKLGELLGLLPVEAAVAMVHPAVLAFAAPGLDQE